MVKQMLDSFAHDPDFNAVLQGVRTGMKEQLLSGLSGAARSVCAATLHVQLQRPLVILTHTMFQAQKWTDDLQQCLGAEHVLLYPAHESLLTEVAVRSPELLAQRLTTLRQLCASFMGVLIVPYAAVRRFVVPKNIFTDAVLTLRVGERVSMEHVVQHAIHLGFTRVSKVEAPGEMSVRGGILDVYNVTYGVEEAQAYRIAWFDEEIESIRTFDPLDQRSTRQVSVATVAPCVEMFATAERWEKAAQHATHLLEAQLAKVTLRSHRETLETQIRQEIATLRAGASFHGNFKYMACVYPQQATLADYFPADALLLVDEPTRLIETAKTIEREEAEWAVQEMQAQMTLPQLVLGQSFETVMGAKRWQKLYLSLFLRQVAHTHPQQVVNMICRAMQQFHGQDQLLLSEIHRWQKMKAHIYVLVSTAQSHKQMTEMLRAAGVEAVHIVLATLQNGFDFPGGHLVVITEHELLATKPRRTTTTRQIDHATRIKNYTELQPGDYVVHLSHGIGKYEGIGTIVVGGIHRDYVHIAYAGNDKLSIPVDQIDQIQKYVGADEGKEPKLHKLGGGDWHRAKGKAQSAVKEIADELIKLYATRAATPGFAYQKDTPYQQQFETLFPYTETPDQLRAIAEIKRDMERPRPMDRLLCGDVGYGKTEVAIRAAFKAIMDGKQVAVLVPTTILAQQHYETFRERFQTYPCTIAVLSRFRSKKEQAEVIAGMRKGTVDVCIGTHRLLSQDIVFKDLGLLIVDEEQRFGVTHKEKLKKLRANVDVLTLTATPIPRTLHMSMIGVRDLSVIETPPENRFPVQTYVLEYRTRFVQEAIERELARGGQVYFLFNRVQGIETMATTIRQLVPEARVAVAHGQMKEDQLEKRILDFLDGEYDVLVSTSIIETGVDIPNVNTLIVYDADAMGLSQLYQLRGRVGRSNRIAYAYFTYHRDKVLQEASEKRLQAIKEFTQLGSGFKIAMRDLAIRGAGNLLGGQQHGFISSVGFQMYTQMLAEEIQRRKKEMQGETVDMVVPVVPTKIELTIEAYLPSAYIGDSVQKIEMYKRLAAVETIAEAVHVRTEMIDRFGEIPAPVENLLQVTCVRIYGTQQNVQTVSMRGTKLSITWRKEAIRQYDHAQWVAFCLHGDPTLRVIPGAEMTLQFDCEQMTNVAVLQKATQILQQLDTLRTPSSNTSALPVTTG